MHARLKHAVVVKDQGSDDQREDDHDRPDSVTRSHSGNLFRLEQVFEYRQRDGRLVSADRTDTARDPLPPAKPLPSRPRTEAWDTATGR